MVQTNGHKWFNGSQRVIDNCTLQRAVQTFWLSRAVQWDFSSFSHINVAEWSLAIFVKKNYVSYLSLMSFVVIGIVQKLTLIGCIHCSLFLKKICQQNDCKALTNCCRHLANWQACFAFTSTASLSFCHFILACFDSGVVDPLHHIRCSKRCTSYSE